MRAILLFLFCVVSSAAYADCTPANDLVGTKSRVDWVEGGLVYDMTNDVLKTCDGTNWQTVAAGSGLSGGTSGYLGVWTGATTMGLSGTAAGQNLFWNGTTHRLGIGTDAPSTALHTVGTVLTTGSGGGFKFATRTGSAGHDFQWYTDLGIARLYAHATSMDAMPITQAGNVGIGTATPSSALDISSGTLSMLVGADNTAFTRTNSTQKAGRIAVPHYLSAQVPALALMGVSDSTDNNISIGGGSGLANAATTLSFYTAANNTTLTGTRRMFIDASGNVGVGTTAPQSTLEVSGSSNVMTTPTNLALYNLRLRANGPNGSTSSGIHFGEGTGGGAAIIGYDDGLLGKQGLRLYGFDGTNMPLGMAIDSNGNVGIGTTSPSSRLHVAGTTSGASNPLVFAQENPGSITSGWETKLFGGGVNSQKHLYMGLLSNITAGTSALNYFYVNTDPANSNSAYLDPDMVITSGGNVGIGTIAPASQLHILSAASNHLTLETSGAAQTAAIKLKSPTRTFSMVSGGASSAAPNAWALFDDTAAAQRLSVDSSGNFTAWVSAFKPGGGVWSSTSDERLKDIDGDYIQGLDSIVRLNPVSFHYKKDNPRKEPSDKRFVGLVAQDVQKVFPEAVIDGQDGYLSLDTTPINFAVINAIKELKADNDKLRAELKAANDNHSSALDEMRREIQAMKSAR